MFLLMVFSFVELMALHAIFGKSGLILAILIACVVGWFAPNLEDRLAGGRP